MCNSTIMLTVIWVVVIATSLIINYLGKGKK